MIPSKMTVENNIESQTTFINLSEKKTVSAEIITVANGLERLDVLFKNPNLESRDELDIVVSRSDGSLVMSKSFSGFNLGDTSHARVDLPRGVVGINEKLNIEVIQKRIIDGKLMIGVKNGDINMIQYYGSGGRSAGFVRIGETLKRVVSWPPVLLLPLVVGFLALW
jgi:hypothetical protein